MDSTDNRKAGRSAGAATAPALLPMALTGGLVGYYASEGDLWWVLIGPGAAFLVWLGWTITLGLTKARG
jgi:hypothetical protein